MRAGTDLKSTNAFERSSLKGIVIVTLFMMFNEFPDLPLALHGTLTSRDLGWCSHCCNENRAPDDLKEHEACRPPKVPTWLGFGFFRLGLLVQIWVFLQEVLALLYRPCSHLN